MAISPHQHVGTEMRSCLLYSAETRTPLAWAVGGCRSPKLNRWGAHESCRSHCLRQSFKLNCFGRFGRSPSRHFRRMTQFCSLKWANVGFPYCIRHYVVDQHLNVYRPRIPAGSGDENVVKTTVGGRHPNAYIRAPRRSIADFARERAPLEVACCEKK